MNKHDIQTELKNLSTEMVCVAIKILKGQDCGSASKDVGKMRAKLEKIHRYLDN